MENIAVATIVMHWLCDAFFHDNTIKQYWLAKETIFMVYDMWNALYLAYYQLSVFALWSRCQPRMKSTCKPSVI